MDFGPSPTIYAVDDHPDELLLLQSIGKSVGWNVDGYRSPLDFLDAIDADAIGCVVADLMMPQMTGLQLHTELRRRHLDLPIIVVTGHADAATCRTALHDGVFDFIEKGFNAHELIEVIRRALDKNQQDVADRKLRDSFSSQLAALSPRETEVMHRLADGKTLKEIAAEFQISVQTASKHRGNLFSKLSVDNEVGLLKRLMAAGPVGIESPLV